MCPPLTLACANARLGRDRVSSVGHEGVAMLPSGHMIGSTMFRVGNVLYAGDL